MDQVQVELIESAEAPEITPSNTQQIVTEQSSEQAQDEQTEVLEDLPQRSNSEASKLEVKSVTLTLNSAESFYLGRASVPDFTVDEPNERSHHVRMTEVAPSQSCILTSTSGQYDNDWTIPISEFSSKKQDKSYNKNLTKRIRTYYKKQDELITSLENLDNDVSNSPSREDESKKTTKRVSLMIKISFIANVVLVIAKLVAAVLSGSISIVSSLVDSFVDLASGIVIWITARTVKNRKPYIYPQGRTKLEPVAIVVLSVIMSVASLQLVREAIEKIIHLASGESSPPDVDVATIVITSSAIVIKLILFILCKPLKSPSIQVLAQDHRNDVLSNSVALVFGYIGSLDMQHKTGARGLIYVDPGGAIFISIYIFINWWRTGSEQVKLLTGHTAKPDFLKKITWICINHHKSIQYVETVRAFHFGNNFLVEVDIVLPADMNLRDAHNIGEPLQQKLEKLQEVERAFVHIDYNFDHRPTDEHKVV